MAKLRNEVPSGQNPGETKTIRPVDAGTLIILDRSLGLTRVLAGRRHPDQVFLPNKYVFPGGRVEKSDRSVTAANDLRAHVTDLLKWDTKGHASNGRARAIALAALRETYEEAGIIIADQTSTRREATNDEWRTFVELGGAPMLHPLVLLARAITPPGRPRRYDTRFFCVDATHISSQVTPPHTELSDVNWYTLEELERLDLANITRAILADLRDRINAETINVGCDITAPVPYYFFSAGSVRRELLSPTVEHS